MKRILSFCLCLSLCVITLAASFARLTIKLPYDGSVLEVYQLSQSQSGPGIYVPGLTQGSRELALEVAKKIAHENHEPLMKSAVKQGNAICDLPSGGWYLVRGESFRTGNQRITPVPCILHLEEALTIKIKFDLDIVSPDPDPDPDPTPNPDPTDPPVRPGPDPTEPPIGPDPQPTDPPVEPEPEPSLPPVEPSVPPVEPSVPPVEPTIPVEPTTPEHPLIPQTGLDWITPLALAGGGLMLIGFGAKKKR